MKKIITVSLVALATTAGFLLNNQPTQAHNRPYYTRPLNYCYPTTEWLVDEDPAYHPQAYADGYRQGKNSAKKRQAYKPRTAGGEFGRGFDDGYYGREFAGQKHIVANILKPYTTTQCGYF
ncbi:hypothetical protein [aff. Roholtiella sp. LEGE 12411]|uniref:hypothetical protein n=1 Tax=aff. Roholtiella sp. LEGE 12411 TaxID=1828822 RepID=UPI001881623D|nr:hypothetical protein [aff. Roholtiella sp. LEGE 12411]MBE9037905.1 hypothetical protein [aff. Roholtiella sp. LEGE 12411]